LVRRFGELHERSFVQGLVREVEARTGTNAIVDTGSGRVVFRYGESAGGPFSERLDTIRRWHSGDVDDAVYMIQIAKNMSREQKNAVLDREATATKKEDEAALRNVCEEARPDVRNHAAFLDRKRRGVQKVYSA
jgi:hypothetical protein